MSGLARSANLLMRSSRASLLRPSVVNPVHHLFSKDLLAARGLATAFERTKPHVNIGEISLLGFVSHARVLISL